MPLCRMFRFAVAAFKKAADEIIHGNLQHGYRAIGNGKQNDRIKETIQAARQLQMPGGEIKCEYAAFR